MILKVKKLHKNATVPFYAKPGDAGLDLSAVSKKTTDKYIEYGTGLAIEIPENHVGLIFPRSSLSNKDLILANSVGVIDSKFRGEIMLRFKLTSDLLPALIQDYSIGDRIGQLIILPYPKVTIELTEELTLTERGDNSFGSTGN